MSQKFTVTFANDASYEKYIKEVKDGGGVIIHANKIILSFTAEIPAQVLELIEKGVQSDGIEALEGDSVFTVQ